MPQDPGQRLLERQAQLGRLQDAIEMQRVAADATRVAPLQEESDDPGRARSFLQRQVELVRPLFSGDTPLDEGFRSFSEGEFGFQQALADNSMGEMVRSLASMAESPDTGTALDAVTMTVPGGQLAAISKRGLLRVIRDPNKRQTIKVNAHTRPFGYTSEEFSGAWLTREGQPVYVRGNKFKDEFYIEWIGPVDDIGDWYDIGMQQGDVGVAAMREIFADVLMEFPDVTSVTFKRISGMRAGNQRSMDKIDLVP